MAEQILCISNSRTIIFKAYFNFVKYFRREGAILWGRALIIFIIFSCSAPWYNKLPKFEKQPDTIMNGLWIKKIMHFFPLNSIAFKDQRIESIAFNNANKTFIKKSIYKKESNSRRTTVITTGKGIFKVKGNWVLLETNSITVATAEKNIQDNTPEKFKYKTINKKYSLLYHFNNESLIPMVDDSATYGQKSLFPEGYYVYNYGIKDLISAPYNEDEIFFKARRQYEKKVYNSPAYFHAIIP